LFLGANIKAEVIEVVGVLISFARDVQDTHQLTKRKY